MPFFIYYRMSFYNEIVFKLGLSPEECVGGDRVSIFEGKGVLIEGHKGIFSFSPEKITVRMKKRYVSIHGAGLKVIEINSDELYIGGEIMTVERDG